MAVLDEQSYQSFGAQAAGEGTRFTVWAPNAEHVSVIGDFNEWNAWTNPLSRSPDGVFEGVVADARRGARYKYRVVTRGGAFFDKADPFAFAAEPAPGTASVIAELSYEWRDQEWMTHRRERNALDRPISIYEMHVGSWRRVPEENGRPLRYQELAPVLADYVTGLGFTHVEFLPLTEHPYYGSWGYQPSSLFAPTSRYGTPQDLMFLVDSLHRRGVGVILDWVPVQFSTDAHGLGLFDGTRLYESEAPSDWASHAFDYSRPDVRNFLVSSALFWLEKYHFDGLRVDGVASILSAPGGPAFLQQLNSAVYGNFPDVQTIAEDSSAYPSVSRPVYSGGLGFGFKWDLGWMHDTLEYLRLEPGQRKDHHDKLTFRQMYAYNENYVLPLSHDEVKGGFGSLLSKMPGDDWRKFANLRLLLAYQYAQPGKKLLFMGSEFAQWQEWSPDQSLDWHLLGDQRHAQIRNLTGYLNWIYKREPALHQLDCEQPGFEWIDCCDAGNSVISFLRKARAPRDAVLAVFNFTPHPLSNYRVGVPFGRTWQEFLNTDSVHYGGAAFGNFGSVDATPIPWNGRLQSVNLTLPPLAAIFLKPA